MDILEQGTEREPVSPLRRRVATVLVAAAALGIVVARHHPGGSTPPPVAVATPTATRTPTPRPTPAPLAPSPDSATDPALLARSVMPCEWFLDQVSLPKLDKWHVKVVSTTRVGNTQTRTYTRNGGEIRVAAGCGPIKWVLPLGKSDDTNVYFDHPAGDATPATAVWRAEGVVGWYRIKSDGPNGTVLSDDEVQTLMDAIDSGAKSV